MGGSIPSPPHGDPDRILVHPTTPGRLGSPKHYWGAVTGGGSPVAARLAAFGCCQQKHNTKPPQKKGKKKKKKPKQKEKERGKANGWLDPPPAPGQAPPRRAAIAYSGVLAQRMHRYYQLEDISEGEIGYKIIIIERKGTFPAEKKPCRSGGGRPAPGAPGMQRLPRADIGSSNT